MYRELDRRREERPESAPRGSSPVVDVAVLQALRAGDARRLADALHNDLQAAALDVAPGLGGILELGESNGALAGIVSGSGPTVAFLADSTDAALELQVALWAARLNAVHVHGPVHGARIMTPELRSGSCSVQASDAPSAAWVGEPGNVEGGVRVVHVGAGRHDLVDPVEHGVVERRGRRP